MDHIHHIIPCHEWKVRFGSLDGFNAPDNKVRLTVEQHAQVHQLLYEQLGKIGDKLAWNFLLGVIDKQQVLMELNKGYDRSGNKNPMFGKTHSVETKEKIRAARLGSRPTEATKQKMVASHIGLPQSEQKIKKCRLASMGNKANLGRKFSDTHKARISQARFRFIESKKVKA